MNKLLRHTIAFLVASMVANAQLDLGFIEKLGSDIRINADSTSYDAAKGVAVWTGNVSIKVPDAEFYANKAEFDVKTETIRLSNRVTIYRNDILYRGENAVYNTKSGELDATGMRSSFEPIYFSSEALETNTDEISLIETEQTTFTTDDNPDPDWFIKAKKVKIYPDDRVVFIGPKFYVGDTPIFWLPYLAQPLDDQLGYSFTPGYKSTWGAYLLNRYGVLWGDHSIAQFNFDLRSSRGFAGGIDLLSRRWLENPNFGKLKIYGAYDNEPLKSSVKGRNEKREGFVDKERYRLDLTHRVYLPGPTDSTLYLDFNLHKFSDDFFLQDFFPAEFRLDSQPDNTVTLTKQFEKAEVNLFGRFRINDFYQTDTRLPELAIDFVRQPLFDTNLFYWGNSSAGLYQEEIGEPERQRTVRRIKELKLILKEQETLSSSPMAFGGQLPSAPLLDPAILSERKTELEALKERVEDRGFTRAYTYHELLYPINNLGGFLNITPKVGGGYVHYSSIDGPAPENNSRVIGQAGVDLSFKSSKYFPDVKNEALGLDGLMHIIQPYVSYSYLTADDLGSDFNGIDRLVPSTRLRPLDVPQFTAIDSLQNWNIVRAGMENRFLTKRGNGSHPWLVSNTYFDTFLEDPEFNRDFSNLYQDLAFYPKPWLRFNLGGQLPVFGGDFDYTELNTGISYMPTRNFEIGINHRFLQDHPFFEDSNLVDIFTYTRMNDNWSFSTYHRYEFDDSTLESQQYTLHRDLTTWSAALGVVVTDNRGQEESGFVFSLTLKDFPSVALPLDLGPGGFGRNGR